MKSKDKRFNLNILNNARREIVSPELSLSNSDGKMKFNMLPSDFYLKREDMISFDRRKNLNLLSSSHQAKDVSYLYESLGSLSPSLDSNFYPLPLEMSEVTLLLNSEAYSPENLFKRTKNSKPFGRKDAINLYLWLEEMHKKYLIKLDKIIETQGTVDSGLSEAVEAIYIIALKESIKHLAVNCIERAEMIHKIFEVLLFTWKKAPDDSQKKIESLAAAHQQEILKIKKKYKAKCSAVREKYKELELKMIEISKEKELLSNETNMLKKNMIKLDSDIENKVLELNKLKYARKIKLEIGIQTDYFLEDDEESSDISNEEPKVEAIKPATISRSLTRQKTLALEKRQEQLNHLRKHIELASCSEKLVTEDLYQYIHSDFCDFYAWVDGFRLAVEILKEAQKFPEPAGPVYVKQLTVSQIYEKSIQKKPKNEDKRKTQKENLKLKYDFKPNITIAQHINENSPIHEIINYLSSQSMQKISSISTMNSKKLSNQISNYINAAKSRSIDEYGSFSMFVYSLLFQKYSLKPIASRKFKELVANCIRHSSLTQVIIFLRMIEAGICINSPNFSVQSSNMCVKMYSFMTVDKTGIVPNTSNPSLINYFPTARGLECIKQLLESLISLNELQKLKKTIEGYSIEDPYDINRSGLIELHNFVFSAIEVYQDYTESISKGVQLSIEALTDYKYITWREANVLIRNINPKKELKEDDKSIIQISSSQEIEIEEFQNFCIQRGMLKMEDYNRFFNKNLMTPDQIIVKVNEIKELLPGVLEKCENVATTFPLDEWDGKFDDIAFGLKGRSQERAIKMWTLMHSEFLKLFSLVNRI
jgi:hypothetical protein